MDFTKHKNWIIENCFCLSGFLNRLPLVEDKSCKTAWTDGKQIGYNPQFMESLRFLEVCGVIVHEIMHVANFHHLREGNREHKRWNSACDYAINPNVLNIGLLLPKGCLIKSQFDKMSAEEIYRLLPSEHEGNYLGEVRRFEGNEEEQKEEEEAIKSLVTQSKILSKKIGDKSGGLIGQLFDNLNLGKINWKNYLEIFLDEVAKMRYDWMRPNKRYADFVLPTLGGKSLGCVVFIVDTSGSIREEEMQHALSECNEILHQYDAELHVIYSDEKINDYYVFDGEKSVKAIKGRGGTDFRAAISFANNIHDASCIVYFTDGMTSNWGETELPTLWLGTRLFNPPYGDFISYV